MTIHINSNSSPNDLEKELKKLSESKKNSNSLAQFAGKLKGVFGDGLDYQKKLRNEWN
jgi:hypothetical protein